MNDGPNPTTIPIKRMIHSTNPISWLKTGRYLKKKKPDLIICKFWMPFFGPSFGKIFRMAKSNGKTKVLCVVDNIIPHERRFFDKGFAQYFVNSVDYFVAMSEAVQKDLGSFVKEQPIKLVRHPIYDNYGDLVPKQEAVAKLQVAKDETYILFFGFIRAYKGLDLLIQAVDDQFFVDRKIKLIIAGEYYDKEEKYRDLIDKMTYPDIVIEKTQFIADDEVRYYFGATDLVVQPYKSATQSGISQLAIYFEKPMVVTDVGGLKEIIGEGKGGYVVPVDVEAIRNAIKRYFGQTDQRAMVDHIKTLKELYSWSKFYDELEYLQA